MRWALTLLTLGTLSFVAIAEESVSITPAVIMLKGSYGQSTTQEMTIINGTSIPLSFDLLALDVVIKDGKRVYVPAGETPKSVASTALFSQKSVDLKPHESASVRITFTVPQDTSVRGLIGMFQGVNRDEKKGTLGMVASLGTLFTVSLKDDYILDGRELKSIEQTASKNALLSEVVFNTGTDPVVPEGVAAILAADGKLVTKCNIETQRLMPGEQAEFRAEIPIVLDPGTYRAVATYQYGGKTLTKQSEFKVPVAKTQ